MALRPKYGDPSMRLRDEMPAADHQAQVVREAIELPVALLADAALRVGVEPEVAPAGIRAAQHEGN